MNRAETATLLAKVQAYDNRTVGEVTVAAWAEALADVNFQEALDAVAQHYRTETTWLMPAHLMKIVGDVKFRLKRKLQEFGPPDFPPGLNWRDEKRYREDYQGAILTGQTREEALDTADGCVDMYLDRPDHDAFRASVLEYRAMQRGEIPWPSHPEIALPDAGDAA